MGKRDRERIARIQQGIEQPFWVYRVTGILKPAELPKEDVLAMARPVRRRTKTPATKSASK